MTSKMMTRLVKHRIIELLRLEKTHRIIQSNHSFALHQWFLLNHVPQHNIQTLFEHHQARWLHHLSGQPIPVPDHPFREVVFPNIQSESSLAQLEAIPSSPITSHTRICILMLSGLLSSCLEKDSLLSRTLVISLVKLFTEYCKQFTSFRTILVGCSAICSSDTYSVFMIECELEVYSSNFERTSCFEK